MAVAKASDVSVSIDSFETRSGAGRNSKEKFTTYCMAVVVSGECAGEWTVYRRYSQFVALHKTLDADIRESLKLPPKRISGNFKESFLEGRRIALQDYMMGLLAVDDVFGRSPDLKSFLGIKVYLLGSGGGAGRQGQALPNGRVAQNKRLTEFNWVHRTGGVPPSALRGAAAADESPRGGAKQQSSGRCHHDYTCGEGAYCFKFQCSSGVL